METGFKHFNNKINKHKRKAAAPQGRLPLTKHKIKFRPGSLLSSLLLLSFRSSFMGFETGEGRRCCSLSFTPPASLRSHGSRPCPTRHIPLTPLAGREYPRDCSLLLRPPPGGACQGLGVRTDEAREQETEG